MIFIRSPIYFVTASTHHRRDILARPQIHLSFVQFGEEGPDHGVWIGAYVLMPDHFHAFVKIDAEQVALSRWMKSLKNVLSTTLRLTGIEAHALAENIFRSHITRR
jgi:REP element-mobilizing transposase RayT